MSKAPIMPFYTDAWLGDTLHLNTEEQGAYLLLILQIWRRNGEPLPNDDVMLARITRLSRKRWQTKIRPNLEAFFDITEDGWQQGKAARTWSEVMRKSNLGKRAAEIRHAKRRKSKKTNDADAAFTHVGPHMPSMIQDPRSKIHTTNNDMVEIEESVMKEALRPVNAVLNNVRYFVQGAPPLTQDMHSRLQVAKQVMQQALIVCGDGFADEQTQRLWRHYRKREVGCDEAALHADYVALLADYPADVVRHSVQEILDTRKYSTLPPLAELKEKLEPPITLRRWRLSQIKRLSG